MAKNTDTTAPTASAEPTIEIRSHVAAPKDLPYMAYVDALIKATDEGVDEPETSIRVPNGEKNAKGEYMELAKHKRYVQDAAKARGYSAKIWGTEDFGDGTSTITFGIRSAIKRTRKPKVTEDATPAEAPAAA